MQDAWIIDACRTRRAVGKCALAEIHPQRLAATVSKAIAKRNDLDTGEVDDVIGARRYSAASKAPIWAGWPRSMRATT